MGAMNEQLRPVFILMPQWQGSPSSRAMQLIDGAAHLRGDLPASARFDVSVPAHAGDALGTPVARLSTILASRDAAHEVLKERAEPAIVLGGDTSSTLAGLEHAVHNDPGVAVLWFDSRPRLEHPSTSPTGAAAGMVLRHALGDGIEDLAFSSPVDPHRVLLVGTREIDPEEQHTISELGIRHHAVNETAAVNEIAAPNDAATSNDTGSQAAAIREWIADSGATSLYIHIGLDVLDPSHFASVHAPVPFGMSVQGLTSAIRAAVQALPLAGAAICEFAPADETMANDDAPTVLRILAALTSGGTR